MPHQLSRPCPEPCNDGGLNNGALDHERVAHSRRLCTRARGWPSLAGRPLAALLVQAACYRMFAPALAAVAGVARYSREVLDRRAGLVEGLLKDAALHSMDLAGD